MGDARDWLILGQIELGGALPTVADVPIWILLDDEYEVDEFFGSGWGRGRSSSASP
jgi:hypothetical protein